MGRLRFNKNARFLLENDENYFLNLQKEPLKLNRSFTNKKPLAIEIGMGKGDFIITNALNYSEVNFIGIEKFDTVLAKALKKLGHYKLSNLKMTSLDAEKILEYFDDKSVDQIYLNFSDPWPKKAHEKRRLIHPIFLNKYQKILKENGKITFKTDNENLFLWFTEMVNKDFSTKIKIHYLTHDLYKDINHEYYHNNIQTEYEKKFLEQNKKIHKIVFSFTGKLNSFERDFKDSNL